MIKIIINEDYDEVEGGEDDNDTNSQRRGCGRK
jgi:hypothetical protein